PHGYTHTNDTAKQACCIIRARGWESVTWSGFGGGSREEVGIQRQGGQPSGIEVEIAGVSKRRAYAWTVAVKRQDPAETSAAEGAALWLAAPLLAAPLLAAASRAAPLLVVPLLVVPLLVAALPAVALPAAPWVVASGFVTAALTPPPVRFRYATQRTWIF